MKKLIALLLALIFLLVPALTSTADRTPATQTDLDPIELPISDFTPSISDLN